MCLSGCEGDGEREKERHRQKEREKKNRKTQMTGTGKLGYWKMAEDDYVEKILRILQAVSLFNVFKMSTGKCAIIS